MFNTYSFICVVALLLVFGGAMLWDALHDKTPRRQLAPGPVQAVHRDLLWWTSKRTPRERMNVHIQHKGK